MSRVRRFDSRIRRATAVVILCSFSSGVPNAPRYLQDLHPELVPITPDTILNKTVAVVHHLETRKGAGCNLPIATTIVGTSASPSVIESVEDNPRLKLFRVPTGLVVCGQRRVMTTRRALPCSVMLSNGHALHGKPQAFIDQPGPKQTARFPNPF